MYEKQVDEEAYVVASVVQYVASMAGGVLTETVDDSRG